MTYLCGLKSSIDVLRQYSAPTCPGISSYRFTPAEFEALLIPFKYHWDEYYSHFTLEGKVRQRISYNRKTSVLPLIQDKMFFILVYLKTNPLQELHAIQYEITQPPANKMSRIAY